MATGAEGGEGVECKGHQSGECRLFLDSNNSNNRRHFFTSNSRLYGGLLILLSLSIPAFYRNHNAKKETGSGCKIERMGVALVLLLGGDTGKIVCALNVTSLYGS